MHKGKECGCESSAVAKRANKTEPDTIQIINQPISN